MEGSNNQWKVRFVSFTGHGYINFPAKESCLAITEYGDEMN